MRKFYTEMLNELKENRSLVVATIIATEGSVPRSQGTKMLVTGAGTIYGTIGGGDLEFTAIKQALAVYKNKKALTKTYNIHQSKDESSTLEGSGKVTLNFQYFHGQDSLLLTTLKELEKAFISLTSCLLVTEITNAGTQLFINTPTYSNLPPLILEAISAIDAVFPYVLQRPEGLYIVESPVNLQRVLVYGSGHVGVEIINLLGHLGFYVVVIDSRTTQIEASLIPGAKERHLSPIADAVSLITPTEHDYVLITTPNHDSDYQVLSQVLNTPAHYVGMLGSQRKVTATVERLKRDGYSSLNIKRIVSPIGLKIGAQTPAEIAVSVAAQFIQIRAEL